MSKKWTVSAVPEVCHLCTVSGGLGTAIRWYPDFFATDCTDVTDASDTAPSLFALYPAAGERVPKAGEFGFLRNLWNPCHRWQTMPVKGLRVPQGRLKICVVVFQWVHLDTTTIMGV